MHAMTTAFVTRSYMIYIRSLTSNVIMIITDSSCRKYGSIEARSNTHRVDLVIVRGDAEEKYQKGKTSMPARSNPSTTYISHQCSIGRCITNW